MNTLVLERPLVAHPAKYQRVADALKALRTAARLTQEDVAHAVGLTLSGYRGYEQGKRDLKAEQIEMFAAVFDVPVSEITRRLWPEDERLVTIHLSHDWDELQEQVKSLPPEIAEQMIRAWRDSVAVIHNASDLARRN